MSDLHESRIGLTRAESEAAAHNTAAADQILVPAHEGDPRAALPAHPGVLDTILALPHHYLEMMREIHELANVIREAFHRQVWANLDGVSAMAQTGTVGSLGVSAWIQVYQGVSGQGIHMKNVIVGSPSAPITFQLVAARASELNSSPPMRILATVRVTSSYRTLPLGDLSLWLLPGESLFAIANATAACVFDFCGEYRIMRGE